MERARGWASRVTRMSKGGGEHGLTLIVAPTAVEPTMCTCRELPRHIVDPGAIKAALERERGARERLEERQDNLRQMARQLQVPQSDEPQSIK